MARHLATSVGTARSALFVATLAVELAEIGASSAEDVTLQR